MKYRSKNYFEAIGDYPHNLAVYLTYTLDREVVDKLSEYATGTKLILHDIKNGITIEDNYDDTIICQPITTLKPNDNNCFHPKLALLKSENGAKLIVGSTNLSVESFRSEKEIALEIELRFDSPTDVYIYNKVIEFFSELNRRVIITNGVLDRTINRLRVNNLRELQCDIEFIFNTHEESIYDKITGYLNIYRMGKAAQSIKIATPFVSEQYSGMDELRCISNEVSVYLRNGAKISPFIAQGFKVFQPTKKSMRKGFHAKIIQFEYETDCVIYIGSSNFTEQGFFKSLNESANQECGLLLSVSKGELDKWFDKDLWKLLLKEDIDVYEETENGSTDDLFESPEPFYVWAEKDGKKSRIYISCVDGPGILNNIRTIRNKAIPIEQVSEYLYMADGVESIRDKVSFYIGETLVTIPIFDINEYFSVMDEKGESIFHFYKGEYSVNPREMDAAIDKGHISVKGGNRIEISEPPKLEQYFYNVKNMIKSLQHKKYYSYYNVKEIEKEINQSSDGRTLFLTLQLLNLFNASESSNTKDLKYICYNRLLTLGAIHEINEASLIKLFDNATDKEAAH